WAAWKPDCSGRAKRTNCPGVTPEVFEAKPAFIKGEGEATMDLRNLKEFFEEKIDARALHDLIVRETQLFGARMEGGEACIPLYGSHGNFHLTVRAGHLKLLCH